MAGGGLPPRGFAVEDVLRSLALFEQIPLDGLSHLAQQGQARTFEAGSQLMQQGAASDCMHIILRGRVQVERSHPDLKEPLVLAELGPGQSVGEMGVLDDEPRSATVVALEETETMEISAHQLAEVVLRYPEVTAALLRTITRRLRNTDELAEEMARRSRV